MSANRKRRRTPQRNMLTLSFIGLTLAMLTTTSQPANADIALKKATSVRVTPAQVLLAPGAQALFRAMALDENGNPATGRISFKWDVAASAGEIVNTTDNAAWVRAGIQPGNYANAVSASIDKNTIGYASINIASINAPTISIAPSLSTATVGDTRLFTATVSGGPAPASVTWQVSPALGTLQSTGPFTALVQMGSTPGFYMDAITASATGATPGTASVDLNAGPPAKVVVAPASATLAINATQTFTAAVFDRFGNLLNLGVTWLAKSGATTIDTFTGNSAVLRAGTKASVFVDGLRAVQSGVEAVVPITIPAGPPANLTLGASPAAIKTDGQDSSTITAQVADAYGNVTGAGAQINFSVEGCAGVCSVTPAFGVADAQGRFAATLRSTNTSPTQSLTSQMTVKGVMQAGATTASATTLVAGSFTPAKSFLALLSRDYPINNHSSCTALRVTPPVTVVQPPNQEFNLYRFTAASTNYTVAISGYSSSGQLRLYRINSDRCTTNGSMSLTLISSAPIAAGDSQQVLSNVFEAGVDYLLALQTTGALSNTPYRIEIRP